MKALALTALLLGLLVMPSVVSADKPDDRGNRKAGEVRGGDTCTSIKDGTLRTSEGTIITMGFDDWGYNYQAGIFKGGYCDSYRNADWCQSYKDDRLIMKWNHAWMSNRDCDGDGLLDRHSGFTSYMGSGAWLTNHSSGEYEGKDAQTCKWSYFARMVAPPTGATLTGGIWYDRDGKEIGPAIWGEFAIVHEVSNDPCAGEHGLLYRSPDNSGLGNR